MQAKRMQRAKPAGDVPDSRFVTIALAAQDLQVFYNKGMGRRGGGGGFGSSNSVVLNLNASVYFVFFRFEF